MPAAAPRFIADSNVGRLARWLRILGYDVTYDAFIPDAELVRQALAEDRIILTRDNGVILRKAVRHYVFVLHDAIEDQLRQVLQERALQPDPRRFWTRCPMDNAPIHPVPKADVAGRVPPFTFASHDDFSECPHWRRIYWRGSHLDRFLARIADVVSAPPADLTPEGTEDHS